MGFSPWRECPHGLASRLKENPPAKQNAKNMHIIFPNFIFKAFSSGFSWDFRSPRVGEPPKVHDLLPDLRSRPGLDLEVVHDGRGQVVEVHLKYKKRDFF